MKPFEAVATGDTLELRMYGVIGSRWDENAVTATQVSRALKESPNCKTILIRMSSPGGAAFEGAAIRSMLAQHSAKVTCEVEGLCASAASIIAMAADTIRMHEGTAMMIHEASTITQGDAQEHRRAMDALTTLNDGMASLYAARSGMGKEECLTLMAAETWLTPEQAVEKKFADEVIKGKQPPAAFFAFDLKPFGYRHVPDQFTAAVKPPQETKDMSLAQIATALGLDSSSDAAAALGAVANLQARTQAADQSLAELRALTNTADIAALTGAVRGLIEAAKQVPALQATIAEQKAAIEAHAVTAEEQKRASIFAADKADPKGRKLTPALEKFYAEKTEDGKYKRSVGEIEAFLAVAPHTAIVTQQAAATKPVVATQQPAVTSTGTAAPAAESGTEILTHNGKAWEQLEPAEKHNLYVDNPELYAALQANHAQRGKPRQQKRASA